MVDFPIRVVISPEGAARGAQQVGRSLSAIETRADRLRTTIQRTFAPVRLAVDRSELEAAGRRIAGVRQQVEALRRLRVPSPVPTGLERSLIGIDRAARRAGQSILSAGRAAARARLEFGGLERTVAALGGAFAVREIVNAGREYQRLQLRIRSVSADTADAERNLNLVRQVSDETGTSLASNAEIFARLSIATRSLGISSERTANIVRTLNQSLVLGGASAGEAAATVTQLGQALASGRLQGDELRSLLENAPALAEELAKQLGVTIGELRELGATGQLTSERLIGALEGAAATINRRFFEIGPTFDQSLARLENSFTRFGQAIVPVLGNVAESIENIAETIDIVSEAADRFGSRRRRFFALEEFAEGEAERGQRAQRLVREAQAFRAQLDALRQDPTSDPRRRTQIILTLNTINQELAALTQEGIKAKEELDKLLGVADRQANRAAEAGARRENPFDFVPATPQAGGAGGVPSKEEVAETVRLEAERNNQLDRAAQLLDSVRTPFEQRIALQSELNELLEAGVIGQAEYNLLIERLPELQANATSQFGDFIAELERARAAADNLGESFGSSLVGAIGGASNALADFALSGARDLDTLREQLSNILRDLAQQILAAIIQALILRAITSGIGGGAGAGAAGDIVLPGGGIVTLARAAGGPVAASRGYSVSEAGSELYVRQSSPLAASVSASRATRRISTSISRSGGRAAGGAVMPGAGALLLGPGVFQPPTAGQIVPAAQTAAMLNQDQRREATVVQAPAPRVDVSVTPQIVVGGKVFREAIRTDPGVQSEIAVVTRRERDGIRR